MWMMKTIAGEHHNAGRAELAMESNLVLRITAKMLMPFILLFGLYVQFHGDFGPGGGFQAGVIFATGIILYGLVFGLDNLRELVPSGLVRIVSASGLLLYIGVGVVSMLKGGSLLDYNLLSHDPVHGQHLGIFLVELGVGMTVAAVMTNMFILFARP